MAWTQATIDNLKSKNKPYKKSQDNLVVKVHPTGHIAYYAYIRRKDVHLGNHPDLTLRQAKKKKETMFADMYMGKLEETKLTFEQFVNSKDFQEWSIGNRKTHEARMKSMEATILPKIGNVKLSKFSQVDISRYKNSRLKSGVKHSTINRELNDISGVFTQAFKFEYINNPIKVEKFKEDRGKERRVLEDWEVKALRDAAHSIEGLNSRQAKQKKHIGLIVDIALWCGLRKGELLKLQWGDVVNKGHYMKDLEGLIESGEDVAIDDIASAGFSEYAFQIRGDTTKTGQTRLVPISTILLQELITYYIANVLNQSSADSMLGRIREMNKETRKEMSDPSYSSGLDIKDFGFDKWMFQPEHREQRIFPYKKVDNSFNTARNKAGLDKDVTLHSLRHNFCSKALEAGMSLHCVKDLAGHASITTTEIYLHTNPRIKFEQYRMFENKMSTITQ